MQRVDRVVRLASSRLALAASLAISPLLPGHACAKPDGFYLGGAYYRANPEPRPRRRNDAPAQTATVPLPVPRPRFPGDLRPLVEPRAPAPAREPPAPSPAETSQSSQRKGPADTARPKSIEPAPSADATKREPEAVPPAEKPGDTTAPLPPQKPAALGTSTEHPAASAGEKPVGATATPPIQPAVSPSGATNAFTPRSPDDDPACTSRLAGRHVEAEPIAIGPQPDPRCTVIQPVRLSGLVLPDGGKVAFPDRPTIACTTADVFSLYVRDLLVPLAKGTFNSPIAAVWTGPGLECRSRDHIFGAKLSAHGQGLAIDIAQLKLADGRMIAVGEPKTDIDTAFETASRAAACGYFHTVLGPGSDSYHRTHWHFDLEVRGTKGDAKYCK